MKLLRKEQVMKKVAKESKESEKSRLGRALAEAKRQTVVDDVDNLFKVAYN